MPPEREDDATVVVVASMKATAVVVTPGGGWQRCGGHVGVSVGVLLVLRLTTGALDATSV